MMNVLAQPPQAKVIGSRALSSSVSGKAGFGMNEAVRLSGRPRSKSQGISSSGLYTSPSSPGRNVVSRDSLYSRSVSSNYVPSQPGNLTTRLPTDVHNYISTALRSHRYIESGEDCITQKAQVSSSTPSTDRADHQRQTPHRTERKSSGGIDSAQASSVPDRPTTPSALPRPSFRFSERTSSQVYQHPASAGDAESARGPRERGILGGIRSIKSTYTATYIMGHEGRTRQPPRSLAIGFDSYTSAAFISEGELTTSELHQRSTAGQKPTSAFQLQRPVRTSLETNIQDVNAK
jgi:hypothetical protein